MTRPLTMPGQVTRIVKPGTLLKRPQERRSNAKLFRSARDKDASYLALIRELPCIKCGLELFSEACHVRYNSAAFGKRQAAALKPDDKWTVPLCASCHRIDDDSQHIVGEHGFWHRLGMNPLLICESLQKASPDILKMRAVVFRFIENAERMP